MSRLFRPIASAALAIALFAPLPTDEAKARIRCYGPDAYGRTYCVRYRRAPALQEPPYYYYPSPAPEAEPPRALHTSPPTGFR
jgi:hypothetical protein